MTEYKSLEKFLPKADHESSILKQTIARRLHVINNATEQEHYLNRPHVIMPAPIRSVVETIPEVELEIAQNNPGLANTIDADHTLVYVSERDSRLAHAQQRVMEAYEASA